MIVTLVPARAKTWSELEADDPGADENQRLGQCVEIEDVLASDDVRETRDRQAARRRAGSDDDLAATVGCAVDGHGVGIEEARAAVDDLDAAALQHVLEHLRHAVDEGLLALDQLGPIEPGRADADVVLGRQRDRLQRLGRGDQHLLRYAAAQRAGATYLARFDQCDRASRGLGRTGRGDTGVAAA